MSEPLRIGIHGAAGRMGQALLRLADAREDMRVTAALVRPGSQAQARTLLAPDLRIASTLDALNELDVLIDFAGAAAFDDALALACRSGIAFVSGSTGLSDAQLAALDQAALGIPVLWSANFSLGVAVLAHLVRETAARLQDWDCEILESHHRHKLDAPSGTALMLGQCAAQGRPSAPLSASTPIADRSGARVAGSIGYAVLRGGDVAGEHMVSFFGEGECVELAHRATHRDIFARGALTAARWIVGRAPGRYQLADVLALD